MTLLPSIQLGDVNAGYVLTDADFASIAGHAYKLFGLHLPPGKRDLVYSRLIKRLRNLGLPDFASYCALLDKGDAEEQQRMLSALTTNVTHFFREAHHFETLRKKVLPPLLDAARHGTRVRIWSAGCSSGQEPYSIALTILEMMPDAARYDVRVLASDVDQDILARAKDGRYDADSLEGLSQEILRSRFVAAGQAVTAGPELRQIVAFAELNLMSEWPMRGPFDVIFCRNVAIYFDKPTQQRLWERFARILNLGGHLFIGHSERITGPAEQLLKGAGVTTYQRAGAQVGQEEGKPQWA